MKKHRIIEEKRMTAEWASGLKEVQGNRWNKPFYEGGWATADVIAHFIIWDKFVMENRVKPFLNNEEIPSRSVDVQQMNNSASKYAKGRTQLDIIEEFIQTRNQLVALIEAMPEKAFNQYLQSKEIKWHEYWEGLIEHDRKHMQQINRHLETLNDNEVAD